MAALYETLDRMRLPHDFVPVVKKVTARDEVAARKLSDILDEHGKPEILVIDRLDMLLTDRRGPAVVKVFSAFQDVAEGNGCAIIGLWGSPKRMSTKDAYKAPRDAASGASEVGSMANTVLWCREDYATKIRHFVTEFRNASTESHEMAYWPGEPDKEGRQDDGWLHDQFDRLQRRGRADPVEVLKAAGLTYSQVKDVVKVSEATWHRRK
jgi:hypothetical protein